MTLSYIEVTDSAEQPVIMDQPQLYMIRADKIIEFKLPEDLKIGDIFSLINAKGGWRLNLGIKDAKWLQAPELNYHQFLNGKEEGDAISFVYTGNHSFMIDAMFGIIGYENE